MMDQRSVYGFSRRSVFLVVFAVVTVVLVGASLGVVSWIAGQLLAGDAPPPSTSAAIYTNYDPGNTADYILADSLTKMTQYQQQFPEPQNVQVLTGLNTGQISQYMISQVAGGLKVDCTYCHILTDGNFADETNPNKAKARVMMQMAAALNQEYVSQLQVSVGTKQITCATCHNGRPVNVSYPEEINNTQPAGWQLPLQLEYPGGLQVTGDYSKGLESVALNQQTMYHMNVSLGVGCTFCHNARYFPSDEIAQKGHAVLMLQMVQSINSNEEWKTAMQGNVPSCWTCHQGNNLPPGSANRPEDVPAVLSTNPPAGTRQPDVPARSTCLLCHPERSATQGVSGAAAPTNDE